MQFSRSILVSSLLALAAVVCFVLARSAFLEWSWGHVSVSWLVLLLGLAFLLASLSSLAAPRSWWERPSTPTEDAEHTLVQEPSRQSPP